MTLKEAEIEVRKIAKRCGYRGALSDDSVKECAEVYLANCDEEGTPKPRHYMRSGENKATHLTEIQWLLTRTPSFKKWFGKSVIVDENGDPIVMYHGTWKSFSEFKPSSIKLSKVAMTLWSGPGFYFTDSEKVAKIYAGGEGDNIYDVFLRMTNPLIVDETGNAESGEGISKKVAEKIFLSGDNTQWLDSGLANELAKMDEEDGVKKGGKHYYKGLTRAQRVSEFVKRLKTDVVKLKTAALAYGAKSQAKLLESVCRNTGHDGVIHTITPEVKEWVVYDPKAIKSSSGNNGEYSSAKTKTEDSAETISTVVNNGGMDMGLKAVVDALSGIFGNPADNHEEAMDIVDRNGRHHEPKGIPPGGQFEEEGKYLTGHAKFEHALNQASTGKYATMLREQVAPLYAKMGKDSQSRATVQKIHEDIRGLSKDALKRGMVRHRKDMDRHAKAFNEVKDMDKEQFRAWLQEHPEYNNELTAKLMNDSRYNKHYGVKGGYHDDGTGKQKHEAWEEAKWNVGARVMTSMILFQEHADALHNAPDSIMANMIDRAGREEPHVENRTEETQSEQVQAAPTEQIVSQTNEGNNEAVSLNSTLGNYGYSEVGVALLGYGSGARHRSNQNGFNFSFEGSILNNQQQEELKNSPEMRELNRFSAENYRALAFNPEGAPDEIQRVNNQWKVLHDAVLQKAITLAGADKVEQIARNANAKGLIGEMIATRDTSILEAAVRDAIGMNTDLSHLTINDLHEIESLENSPDAYERLTSILSRYQRDGESERENNLMTEEVEGEPRDAAEMFANYVDSQAGAGSPQNEHITAQTNESEHANAQTYTDRDGNTHPIVHTEGGLKAEIHPSEIFAVKELMRNAIHDQDAGVEGAREYFHALSHFLGRGQDERSPHPGMTMEGLLKHQLADKMQARLEKKSNALNEAQSALNANANDQTREAFENALRDKEATVKAVKAIAEKCAITPEMLPDGTNFNHVRTALGAPIRAANPDNQEAVNALHALANPTEETESEGTANEPAHIENQYEHYDNSSLLAELASSYNTGASTNTDQDRFISEAQEHLNGDRPVEETRAFVEDLRQRNDAASNEMANRIESNLNRRNEATSTQSESEGTNNQPHSFTPEEVNDLVTQLINSPEGQSRGMTDAHRNHLTYSLNGILNGTTEVQPMALEQATRVFGENHPFTQVIRQRLGREGNASTQQENAQSAQQETPEVNENTNETETQNASQVPSDEHWQDAERRLSENAGPDNNVRSVLNRMRQDGWASETNRGYIRDHLGADHPITRWAEEHPFPRNQETTEPTEQNTQRVSTTGGTHIPDYSGFDQSRVRSSRGRNGFKIPTEIGPTTRIDADLIDNLIHRMPTRDQRRLTSYYTRFNNFLTGNGPQPREFEIQHAQRQFASRANPASRAMASVIGELRMRRSGAIRDARVAQLTREQKQNVIASDSSLAQRAGLAFNENKIGQVKTSGQGDGKNCYRLSNWAIAQIRGITPKYVPSTSSLPNENLVNRNEFDLSDPVFVQNGRLTPTGSTMWFAHQQKKMSKAYPRVMNGTEAFEKVKNGGNGAIIKMWSGGHSTFLVNDNGQIKIIDSYHRSIEPIFNPYEVTGITGIDRDYAERQYRQGLSDPGSYDGEYRPFKLLKRRMDVAKRKAEENGGRFDQDLWIRNSIDDYVASQGSYYIAPDAGLIPELLADIS